MRHSPKQKIPIRHAFPREFTRTANVNSGGIATIGPRQVYILPTRYGVLLAAALFLMLIGSLNYDSNLGLLFTFLFCGVGIVAILQTWRNLVGLKVGVSQTTPCFAGHTACFPVRLSEDMGRERPAIRLRIGRSDPVTVHLDAAGYTTSQLYLSMSERGEYRLGRVQVHTLYPYGLLRAWAYIDSNASVLVYPRPAASLNLRNLAQYVKSETGDRGMGADDFVGLRPYRNGDPPRHLDWKALARERGLVTRQFGGDRAEQLWIDWEQLHGIDTETRLSSLCRMVLDAAQQDLQYGLKLPNLTLSPGLGDTHKHLCLTALARFGGVGR